MPCEQLKFHWAVIRSSINDGLEGTRPEAGSSMRGLGIVQMRFDKGLMGSIVAILNIFPPLVVQGLWKTTLSHTFSLQCE